jgi:tetratricopeptide (TPR) repeat protein
MKTDPELGSAYRGAAWLLSSCPDDRYRNADLAVQLAEKAIDLDGASDWTYLDALAAAQANAGRFDEAKDSAIRAIESAPAEALDELKSRLALYAKRQPFRLPAQASQRPTVTTRR